MMKKILCVCLIMALMGACIPVSAAGNPAFVVSETAGNPGDTVTLTVSTQNNPGIIGMRLFVAYDSAVLELKKAEIEDLNDVTFGPIAKNPFILSWVDAIHPDNTTNGVLAKLTFTVKANAPMGKSAVSVSYDEADVFNAKWESINFATVAGGVNVGGNMDNGGTVATDKVLHSVTESDGADRGLGFLFSLPAKGGAVTNGTSDISGATISYKGADCQLVRMGALLTTDSKVGTEANMTLSAAGVTNVAVTALWDATATACTYAVRLKNIPDSAVGRTVYARPYYVVKYQGKDTVVYGSIDATTYQKHR